MRRREEMGERVRKRRGEGDCRQNREAWEREGETGESSGEGGESHTGYCNNRILI
jgi:hypothetical protein